VLVRAAFAKDSSGSAALDCCSGRGWRRALGDDGAGRGRLGLQILSRQSANLATKIANWVIPAAYVPDPVIGPDGLPVLETLRAIAFMARTR
jgi:hypothetical protein